MIYLPKELPELRSRMAAYSGTTDANFFRELSKDWVGAKDMNRLLLMEGETFDTADLVHIAPSMVDLLMQAKDGIGDAGFMDYDLPVLRGFAYLSAPIDAEKSAGSNLRELIDEIPEDERQEVFDSTGITDDLLLVSDLTWTESLAVLWRYEPPDETFVHGYVVLSWYVERDSWWEWTRKLWLALRQADHPKTWEGKLHLLPPFIYDGHIIIGCHPDAAQLNVIRYDGASENHWRLRRADMFRAMCYLLRQRVAQETTVSPDRAARRRMAREGREPASVRVISIRGASASGGGDGSREYVHRWVVRGHWRRQWYPSIQQNRPIWITPYVKGPEDAPLLGGEKVYVARG